MFEKEWGWAQQLMKLVPGPEDAPRWSVTWVDGAVFQTLQTILNYEPRDQREKLPLLCDAITNSSYKSRSLNGPGLATPFKTTTSLVTDETEPSGGI